MKYCPLCREELKERLIDGVTRLACPEVRCSFVHWNNPVPVVAGLVQWEGKYVLARNSNWPPGIFSFISGFLEAGEEPKSAVIREVREELGLTAKHSTFIGHFPLPELNQLVIAYAIHAHGVLSPNHEIVEVKVVSPTELAHYDFGNFKVAQCAISQWLLSLKNKDSNQPGRCT